MKRGPYGPRWAKDSAKDSDDVGGGGGDASGRVRGERSDKGVKRGPYGPRGETAKGSGGGSAHSGFSFLQPSQHTGGFGDDSNQGGPPWLLSASGAAHTPALLSGDTGHTIADSEDDDEAKAGGTHASTPATWSVQLGGEMKPYAEAAVQAELNRAYNAGEPVAEFVVAGQGVFRVTFADMMQVQVQVRLDDNRTPIRDANGVICLAEGSRQRKVVRIGGV